MFVVMRGRLWSLTRSVACNAGFSKILYNLINRAILCCDIIVYLLCHASLHAGVIFRTFIWVVLEIRLPFRVLFIKVPYKTGSKKRPLLRERPTFQSDNIYLRSPIGKLQTFFGISKPY